MKSQSTTLDVEYKGKTYAVTGFFLAGYSGSYFLPPEPPEVDIDSVVNSEGSDVYEELEDDSDFYDKVVDVFAEWYYDQQGEPDV